MQPALFLTRPPPPRLLPWVEAVWFVRGELPLRRERILPGGRPQLLVNVAEDELRTWTGPALDRLRTTGGACLAGTQPEAFAIDTAEQRAIVGVSFRPCGLAPFAPPEALTGTHVDLRELVPVDGERLRERLVPLRDRPGALLDATVRLLERWAAPIAPDLAIALALARLDAGDPVAAVADGLGFTARHLHRRFTARVGVPPKRYARLARFRRVLAAAAAAGDRVDWGLLAHRHRYADQAHLAHDFRELAGIPPSAFRPVSRDSFGHALLA